MNIINLTPHPLVIFPAPETPTREMSRRERDIAQDMYPEFDALWRLPADFRLVGGDEDLRAAIAAWVKRSTKGLTIQSSGIARCETEETICAYLDGVPVVRTHFGAVIGLPAEDRRSIRVSDTYCPHNEEETSQHAYDTVYIVSAITAQAVPHRKDVFVPARLIRDDAGRIIACAALGTIA